MLQRLFTTGMLTKRWLPLILCINILMLGFYLAIDYQLVYHSDSAVKNLLAQEILETGQYFPADWNYANNDLWVFYIHTFIIPLLPFMHNGYAAGVVSGLVSAALILHGTWLLTGLLEQSRLARLLGMLVISGGMSLTMAEHIYGQAAYGSMYYMACYLLYAYWSLTQARGGRVPLWGGVVLVLSALVFWANPQRALLFYGLPLLAAGAVQYALAWRAARAESGRPGLVAPRQLLALGLMLAGLVVGVMLCKYTLAHVNNNAGLTVIRWLDFKGMLSNLVAVVGGTMELLDGIPRNNSEVASAFGAYLALRTLAALVLMALLPWGLVKALQPRRGPRQLVVVFAAASFGASLFVMLTTTLADMGSPSASVRYLVPSLMTMALVLIGVLVDRRALAPLLRATGVGAVLLLASAGPTSYLYPYNEFHALPRHGLYIMTGDKVLADYLEQQGLRYGYASFWNAGKVTVLSDGAVRIRQVEFEGGLPRPLRKLSSDRWYAPEAWRGPTFLMLRDKELAQVDQPLLASLAGQPRVQRFQDVTLLVYPGNIAASLPAWDLGMRQPLRYAMNERTLHTVGRVENGAMIAEAGQAGALHFGPARTLGRGEYTVSFDVDIAPADGAGEFGMVDVVANGGKDVCARLSLTEAGKRRVTLRFQAGAALDKVEFRAFSSGRGRFALGGIEAARAPDNIAAAQAAQEK